MAKDSSEDNITFWDSSGNIFIQINKILKKIMNWRVWNNEVLNKYVHKVQHLLIVVCKIYKWIKDNPNNVNYSIIIFMANYCQISTNK
jgi:hypothetical protein